MSRIRCFLGALVVLSVLSFGPAPARAQTVDAECSVTLWGQRAELEWAAVDGAIGYVVHRQLDGRDRFWRGRTVDTTFVDEAWTNGGLVSYWMTPLEADGSRGDAVACVNSRDAQVPDTIDCQYRDGWRNGAVTGRFDGEIRRMRLFVALPGEPFRPAVTFGPSLDDPLPTISSLGLATQYTEDVRLQATPVFPDDSIASPVPCPQRPTVEPVPSCTVTSTTDGFLVEWETPGYDETFYRPDEVASNPFYRVEYLVERSTEHGGPFWRGRTDGDRFSDGPVAGDTTYQIVSITPLATFQRSSPTVCTAG